MDQNTNRPKPILEGILCWAAGLATIATLLLAMLAVAPRQAEATQEFTQETGLPCNQCHESPTGGKLTSFGEKFKANGFKVK